MSILFDDARPKELPGILEIIVRAARRTMRTKPMRYRINNEVLAIY